MPLIYHSDLETKPGYNPVEVPDDDGLLRVLADSGWGVVEPSEQTDPALAAVQPGAVYRAVDPEPEPSGSKRGKSTPKGEEPASK